MPVLSPGIPVNITEEDFRKKWPLTYIDMIKKCREIYSDFKQNDKFNAIVRRIKVEGKMCREKKLDIHNLKSPKKTFYSSNVFKEFDKEYTRIKKQ